MRFIAQPSSHAPEASHQNWPFESMEIAQRLLEHIPVILQQLFADGDLTAYLDLLCRMPYHHFLNLLLIYEKNPDAVCLAGTKIWSKFLPPDVEYILKPEQGKKSILLLAPFTNGIENKLLWYSIKVYNVSQTNVEIPDFSNGVFVHDRLHLDLLLDSVEDTLAKKYGLRVITEGSSSNYSLVIPGGTILEKRTAPVHSSDIVKLYWLTERLCEQHLKKNRILLDSSGILIQTLCICLFKIWGITHPSLPSIPKGSYRVISPQDQHAFLNILQHSLYEINQQISSAYLNARKEADEVTVNFDLN